MPTYQKAYYVKQLQKFSGWSDSEELGGETIVFLHEDFTVTKDCFTGADVVFDAVTPEWKAFCLDTLKFEVPDWKEESRRAREQIASTDNADERKR